MRARPKPSPEAISLQDASVILQVSERTIRRWWKSGKIELVRVGPKLLRMPKDVLAKMRRQREDAVAVPAPARAQRDRLSTDVEALAALLLMEDKAETPFPHPRFLDTPRHT